MQEIKLTQTTSFERPDILFSLCRDSASSLIYCGSSDANVYGFELSADEPLQKRLSGHRSYVSGTALTEQGLLVSSSWDRQLIWWDLERGELRRRVLAHDKWIRTVVSSPDRRLVASVADDMVCRIWDAASGNLYRELRGHATETPQHYASMLFTCAFSPDGVHLATADKVGHIVVWDVRHGQSVATFESPENYTWDAVQRRHSTGGVRSLCFSPDGKSLAVGGVGHIENIDGLRGASLIQVYDWQTGELAHKFENDEHNGLVEELHYVREGTLLVAAGGAKKGFLHFIDLSNGQFIHSEATPMHIHQLETSDSVERILAVGHGMVAAWDIKANEESGEET